MADDNPPGDRRGRACWVETVVTPERGQWVVDIVVSFTDGVVRRWIGTYRTRRLAEIAARLIQRSAERDIPGPRND